MKLDVTPLHDRVIVRRIEALEVTDGGIVIPETAKEKPQEAIVLAVGAGRFTDRGTIIPLAPFSGDRVLISKWGGTDLEFDGERVTILREEEILCVTKRAG